MLIRLSKAVDVINERGDFVRAVIKVTSDSCVSSGGETNAASDVGHTRGVDTAKPERLSPSSKPIILWNDIGGSIMTAGATGLTSIVHSSMRDMISPCIQKTFSTDALQGIVYHALEGTSDDT
jgi:hypothetical protein